MEEFLRFLLVPLLSAPGQLAIKTSPYSVVVSVAPEDMGRIIGKKGAVIWAIRNLTRAFAIAHQLPFTTVTLAEPEGE